MSMFRLCAAPETADPAANVTMKNTRTGFRPNADTRLPMSGRTAVEAIVYALPAQMKLTPPRSPTIVGSAVEIAVYGLDSQMTLAAGQVGYTDEVEGGEHVNHEV